MPTDTNSDIITDLTGRTGSNLFRLVHPITSVLCPVGNISDIIPGTTMYGLETSTTPVRYKTPDGRQYFQLSEVNLEQINGVDYYIVTLVPLDPNYGRYYSQ